MDGMISAAWNDGRASSRLSPDDEATRASWQHAVSEAHAGALGFLASPGAAPPELPPAAGTGSGVGETAGGVASFMARYGLRAAGGAAAAGTILLTPTNTQSTTSPATVEGHPDLGARIVRAPGDLSGSVTIFARGQDGQPGASLTTLAMDSQGRLTAPPGTTGSDPGVLGWSGPSGIRLTPAASGALEMRAHGQAAQPEAGGAGGRQPPGLAGSVRPDGECDEDGNVGTTSPNRRLPNTNGRWTGEPGNSGWLSSDARVNAITGGEPIQFANGRPDFTPWAKLSINFAPGELTGYFKPDLNRTYQALENSDNPDVQAAGSAEAYLDQNRLTAHHATDTCIQLVPTALNRLVPHIGSAADLRLQAGSGRTP